MRDPHLVPLFVFGTLLVTGFAVAVIISLIIQKQRQVKNRLARQELAHNYSQALLRSKLEVQETTLATISRELHDNVNQVLTAGVMQLNAAGNYIIDGEAAALVREAKETVKEAISDIRLLSHSLNTGLVEQRDLADALTVELRRIQAFSGIACTLETEDEDEPTPEQRLLLFRIAQEALQNIIKHAGAKMVRVKIASNKDEYRLTITDNGVGFSPQDDNIKSSLGMRNMYERAALLRGSMSVDSAPGKGTTLHVAIPLNLAHG